MPKCVFGLHRHERIACTPFSKRGQTSVQKCRFFALFRDTFPTWWKWPPACVQRVLKWWPGVPKGWPGGVRGRSWAASSSTRGVQWVPKGAQMVAKLWPRAPQGCPREPKVFPKVCWTPPGTLQGQILSKNGSKNGAQCDIPVMFLKSLVLD